VVQELIDKKFPKHDKPSPADDVPTYLPLKGIMMGYPFSGRKTLAKILAEKYGVLVVQYDELIKESVDLNTMTIDSKDEKSSKKSGPKKPVGGKKGAKDEEVKEQPSALKEIGTQIKELKDRGEEVPFELYN